LRKAVSQAKIGHTDKKEALKKLHESAKKIEKGFVPNDNFDKLIEEEWKNKKRYGGRTVMDDETPRRPAKPRRVVDRQMKLF
jgi:galactokinase/mevalonate kinase-like predicted kinase